MSAGNSAYSPLPQSNSDSDGSSEEELQVFRGNRIVNRAAKVQNSMVEKGHTEPKNNVINYKPLDSNSDVGISLNKFQSRPNEVSILKPGATLEVFSTHRKIWFALSLLLCIFTTVAFIWLLPCNLDTCQSASKLKSYYNNTWEENLSDLEVYGPINLVSDVGGNKNLIFLTSCYSTSEQNYTENGLMCLRGRDGSLKWKIKLDEKPIDIDCKLIDVNTDGISDCVVLGRNVLKVVNPTSGKELWDLWKSNEDIGMIYFKEFPLIAPDLDRDGVEELLLLCSFAPRDAGTTLQNYVVIISGQTGQIINTPFHIKMCSTVKDLMFENINILSFTCSNSDGREAFQVISLTKLCKTLKNVTKGKGNFYVQELLSQHVKDPAKVQINGFRLNFENQGDCPENCVLHVQMRNERSKYKSKAFHFSRKNTFGLAPAVLKTKTDIGFLLKLWKFHPESDAVFVDQNEVIIKNNTRHLIKTSKKLNHSLSNSEILDNEMLSEYAWESQRLKRTAVRHRTVRSEKGAFNSHPFGLRVITERILKISLRKSYPFIETVSKDEIIRVCRKTGVCQPDVHKQRHSVLAADLGNDGEKLISFTTKYVHDNKSSNRNSEDWFLQTRIWALNL